MSVISPSLLFASSSSHDNTPRESPSREEKDAKSLSTALHESPSREENDAESLPHEKNHVDYSVMIQYLENYDQHLETEEKKGVTCLLQGLEEWKSSEEEKKIVNCNNQERPSDISKYVNELVLPGIISHEKWKEKVNSALFNRVVTPTFSEDKTQTIVDEVYGKLLKFSSILSRIKTVKESPISNQCAFLSRFYHKTNPILFWEEYKKLELESVEDSKLLNDIIGKSEALAIIKEAIDSDGAFFKEMMTLKINEYKLRAQTDSISPRRNSLRKTKSGILENSRSHKSLSHIPRRSTEDSSSKIITNKTVESFEQKKKTLLDSRFSFSNQFDTQNLHISSPPIFTLGYSELIDTFSPFFPNDNLHTWPLRFNGDPLFSKEDKIKGNDPGKGFVELLISKIQEKAHLKSDLSVEKQCVLFTDCPSQHSHFKRNDLNDLLIKHLPRAFEGEFYPHKTFVILESFLDKLGKESASKSFAKRMSFHAEFVSKYLNSLQTFRESNWRSVSHDLINLYEKLYRINEKYQSIPTLAILKALCYPQTVTTNLLLKEVVCKNMCKKDSGTYLLDLSRTRFLSCDIRYRKGNVKVTHQQSHEVTKDGKRQTLFLNESIVHGNLYAYDYAMDFGITDIHFDCSHQECEGILNECHLDVKNSPWGKHLTLESRKDT